MEQSYESLLVQRERERKAHYFAMDPRKLETILKTTAGTIANAYRRKAKALGIEGETFTDWVEDIVTEGLYMAEKDIDKWNPTLSPDWHWVALHAKSFASRWLENLQTEYKKLERLGRAIVSSNFLREAQSSPAHLVDHRVCIEEMLEAEFSEFQQRILRLSIDGLTIKEIAVLEGRSEQTTQRFINRAQAKARKLGHLYGFEGLRAPPGSSISPSLPQTILDKATVAPKRPQFRSSPS